MAKKVVLTRAAAARIQGAVDLLFDRIRHRFLEQPPVDKQLVVGIKASPSLPDIYRLATATEGAKPDAEVLASLVRVAGSYLDAQQARTKAKIVHAVESWMNEVVNRGAEPDVKRILAGELSDAFAEAKHGVKRIFDTETTRARNTGLLDGIVRVAAGLGIEDPTVFFAVVHDADLCDECQRIHLLPGSRVPRVFKLSEVGHGYHKKGEESPKVGGLHPHCFVGSTRLHTDRGLLTIEELHRQGGDVSVAVDNRVKNRRRGNNQFGEALPGVTWFYRHDSGARMLPASHVYDTGIQPCYRIELDTGAVLEVSDGHEMWVDDGQAGRKVRADHIKTGDKVPLLSGEGGFGKDSFEGLAELMGNLMGDGCIGRDAALWRFFGDDIEYGRALKKVAARYSKDLDGDMVVRPSDEKYTVRNAAFNSGVLRRVFVEEFGLSKKPRRVPRRLWGADKKTVAAFLRGLYAADGHVEGAPAVVLAQNDREFLQEIQLLLSNFGLRSRIFSHGKKSIKKAITYANGDVHDTLRKPCWRLALGSWDQVNVFAREIGMGVPAKQARLISRLEEHRNKTRLGGWRTARVVKVEFIGDRQTYCLTEPMTNTVAANGIVTGQCRCALTSLMPGFGFDANGAISWVGFGHDEYARQRG